MIVDEEIRDKVRDLLQEASTRYILPFFKNLSTDQIDTKSSVDDFVTVADIQSEVFLSKKLMELIKGSTVIGEEAFSDNKDSLFGVRNKRVWTVDPIDGTKNFVNGNERFCSMVALLEDGKPQAAWIFIPTEDKCYYADVTGVQLGYDGSAFNPIEISPKIRAPANVMDFTCSVSLRHLDLDIKNLINRKVAHLKNRVFVGSAGIEATMLAKQQIDFIFHSTTTAWDHAPVELFCKASGGNSAHINLSEGSYSDFKIEQKAPVLFVQNKDTWEEVARFIAG